MDLQISLIKFYGSGIIEPTESEADKNLKLTMWFLGPLF